MTRLILQGLLLASLANAQSVGVVTGLVNDSSGAVVPGAKASLKAFATGFVSGQTTSDSGSYHFPSVLNGPYGLTVEAGRFKTYVRTGLTVETGGTLRVDVALEVGAIQDSVRVTADAPLLLAAKHPDVVQRMSEKMLVWQKTLPAGPMDPGAGRNDWKWPGP